ncbi:50S ribosomal protein L25/general stress protein Ctc [Chitiniphilus eburneus]|uniref:Large ribosomal subunit protein bL25 n=1 Tax=Chitiniphilus eburneus TaxID=2571148 RepID=A0A4U0PPF8_9NEIS|nr:50S ribosomal protein L25/general stress protein Ctc [Chitiniphilus eburneus]TJZ70075.1 50S ribosomal protein L25/general stress protein Ctc [Chitiniphilus eburneus]
MTYEISAQARELQGTGASRRLRKAGQLPGIVYGGNKDPKAIALDHNSMYYQLQDEAFHTALVKLTVGGETEQVLVRNVQYHPFRQLVLHVDFQRVDDSTKVELKVPLHFVNGDTSVGVKLQGGSISHILNEVLVRCVATKLPDFIEVDLGHLDATHGSVHLSDLKLPEGVELMSLVRGANLAVANLNGAKAVAE